MLEKTRIGKPLTFRRDLYRLFRLVVGNLHIDNHLLTFRLLWSAAHHKSKMKDKNFDKRQNFLLCQNDSLTLDRVWKFQNHSVEFHDFSITQILREIKFGDSRSTISATLTHFEALNFDF